MNRTLFGLGIIFLLIFSFLSVFEVKLTEGADQTLTNQFDLLNLDRWSVVDGDWTISDEVLSGTTAFNSEGLIWSGDTTWTDYQFSANVKLVDAVGDVSIVVRYQDSSNFYWIGFGCWGHKYSISKCVNGVYTELAYVGLDSEIEVDKEYLISAVAIGTTLELFDDTRMVLEVQDSAHLKGAVGFRKWNGTMQASEFVFQTEEINIQIQTSDGGYALAGTSCNNRLMLVKTDSNGNRLWSKLYGDPSTGLMRARWTLPNSLLQANDGGYLILYRIGNAGSAHSGSIAIKTDSKGNQLWSTGLPMDYSIYSAYKTSDGGFVFLGGMWGNNQWLIKVDSNGNTLWSYNILGTDCSVNSMIQSSDGGYVLSGSKGIYNSAPPLLDFWIAKIDSAGNQQWNKTYGGASDEVAYWVIQTSEGGYAMAGYTKSFGAGGKDFWIVKTDSVGNQQWNKTYGGPNDEIADSVTQTSDGRYILEGSGLTITFSAGLTLPTPTPTTTAIPSPSISPYPSPSASPIPGGLKLVVASTSASSSDGSWSPINTIDGVESLSNGWWSGAATSLPQWLKLDLGAIANVGKVVTHFYDGDTRSYTYFVEVSVDGSSWSTVVGSKSASGIASDSFSAVSARYIRLTVTANTANNKAHIEEITIYQPN